MYSGCVGDITKVRRRLFRYAFVPLVCLNDTSLPVSALHGVPISENHQTAFIIRSFSAVEHFFYHWGPARDVSIFLFYSKFVLSFSCSPIFQKSARIVSRTSLSFRRKFVIMLAICNRAFLLKVIAFLAFALYPFYSIRVFDSTH